MLAWQKQGNNWRNSSSGVGDAMATLTIIFGKYLPSSGGDLQLMVPLGISQRLRDNDAEEWTSTCGEVCLMYST